MIRIALAFDNEKSLIVTQNQIGDSIFVGIENVIREQVDILTGIFIEIGWLIAFLAPPVPTNRLGTNWWLTSSEPNRTNHQRQTDKRTGNNDS
jgi:hypothetical protein